MKPSRSIRFYLVVAVCMSSLACTGQFFRNYGRITPDDVTTRAFETYSVNPGFRYYISGSDFLPNAIIGINRNYRIDPAALWKEVDMTREKMKDLVEPMQRQALEHGNFQHGFAITDEKGKPIGVWYSILEGRTFVRMQENGTIRIDTPPLDLYKRSGDREPREPRFPPP